MKHKFKAILDYKIHKKTHLKNPWNTFYPEEK